MGKQCQTRASEQLSISGSSSSKHEAACNVLQLLSVAAACMQNSSHRVKKSSCPNAAAASHSANSHQRQCRLLRWQCCSQSASCRFCSAAVLQLVLWLLPLPKTVSPGSLALQWAKAYCKSLNWDALTCVGVPRLAHLRCWIAAPLVAAKVNKKIKNKK